MFELLALFAFAVSGLVGVLLIVWWWADGRGDDGDGETSPSPDAPSTDVQSRR